MNQNHIIRERAINYLQRYGDKPNKWVSEIMGTYLWSKQREILDSVFHNPKTAVRASHAVGKTFVAACAVLAFANLKTPCKIITTAPTWYQVADLLWSELNTLWKTKLDPKGFPGKMFKTKFEIREDWFAMGLSPKEAVNFQGFHQKNVLVVVDEAPGVREEILEASEGLLSAGNTHILLIGNPTKTSGSFFNAFKDPDYYKVHISAYHTPNFTGEDVPKHVRNALVKKEWVEEREKKWGISSPMFQSRVLGNFPVESERQLISYWLCEEAKNRWFEPKSDLNIPETMGLDVARYGDDLTCYVRKRGESIIEIYTESNRSNMDIANRVLRIVSENPGIQSVKIDVVGVGSGVVDRLLEMQSDGLFPKHTTIIGVNGAESATVEEYFNRRTELWFNARNWLESGGCIPDDEDLIADLTAPEFTYTDKGKYLLDPKDKTKKKIGHSPDRGDAFVLAVAEEQVFPQLLFESSSKSMAELGIL